MTTRSGVMYPVVRIRISYKEIKRREFESRLSVTFDSGLERGRVCAHELANLVTLLEEEERRHSGDFEFLRNVLCSPDFVSWVYERRGGGKLTS